MLFPTKNFVSDYKLQRSNFNDLFLHAIKGYYKHILIILLYISAVPEELLSIPRDQRYTNETVWQFTILYISCCRSDISCFITQCCNCHQKMKHKLHELHAGCELSGVIMSKIQNTRDTRLQYVLRERGHKNAGCCRYTHNSSLRVHERVCVCARACLCVFQHSWAGAFEEFLLTSPEQETTEENKEKKV